MASYAQTQASLDKNFKPLKIDGGKNPSLRRLVHGFLIEQKASRDVETNSIVTESRRSRSRQDLYLTLKHYFPGTTYQQASHIFNALKKKELIDTWHCSETRRIVCAPTNMGIDLQRIGEVIDELNFIKSTTRSKNGNILQRPSKTKGGAA